MIQQKNKIVLVFGAFDIIHPGHLDFFKQARGYGDKLIVVIARDRTILRVKKQKPQHPEKERLKKLRKLSLVDQAVLGYLQDYYRIITKINPDVICLGYDQRHSIKGLRKKLKTLNLSPKIVRLKPFHPEKYKSSWLRNKKR